MLLGFLGLTITHGMVMGWKINLEIMVSLLSLSLSFSLFDLLSKQKNRKKTIGVTWMNTLSIFLAKTIGRRLGLTKVLDH